MHTVKQLHQELEMFRQLPCEKRVMILRCDKYKNIVNHYEPLYDITVLMYTFYIPSQSSWFPIKTNILRYDLPS